MAARAPNKKTKNSHSGFGCLFLIAFSLVMIVLFMVNREEIAKNLKTVGIVERVLKKPAEEQPKQPADTTEPKAPAPPKPDGEAKPAPVPEKPAAVQKPAETETVSIPVTTEEPGKRVKPAAETERPSEKTPEKPTAVLRERRLWFVRIDDDGVIARVRVDRQLPASESPLADAIGALLKGPTAQDEKKGCASLIPAETKLLSATVRGKTAYLSFNDAFQFNSYGIEGYAAQLRQIVWTATEFDTVSDVQILIEGRRVDYLGAEGIVIGGPLTRDSLERP